MKKLIQTGLVALGSALAAVPAMAAPVTVDTADITAQIGAGAAAITAVGVAVLGIYALAKSIQMIRKAF